MVGLQINPHMYVNIYVCTYVYTYIHICYIGFHLFCDLLGDPNGHSLWSTCGADGKMLVYCSRCWHYASAIPRCLRDPCSGEGMARGPNKFYLIEGLHPISRLRFDKPTKVQAL